MAESGAPLVSVIVAAYNAAAHIDAACRSALAQTHRRLEVIVVDDGSTDETAAVVGRLALDDPRVRLVSQTNAGVAAARNAAIAASSGEFLAPLDADDLWDSRKLERQLELITLCPQVGLVYCWWVSIGDDGTVLDRSPRWRVEGQVAPRLAEVNFTGNSSVPLFRRAVVAEVGGYDPRLRASGAEGCEDWDLAIRVAERMEVAVAPHVLVAYRRRLDGMSTSCDTMWRSQLQVTAAVAARQPSLSREIIARSHGQFALYLAGVSFWAGDLAAAVRWGLRVRPIRLLVGVLPHAARVLARRAVARAARTGTRLSGLRFADDALPEPLIPYDAMYARRWSAMGLDEPARGEGPRPS
jgi:glycosyltransferase involved in cell wall biosynthesis